MYGGMLRFRHGTVGTTVFLVYVSDAHGDTMLKIATLYCPCGPGEFPPDHYSSGACPDLPMPLAAIRSIVMSDAADTFHADGRVTITRLLTCAREIALTDNVALPAVDLRKRDTLRKGTVLHADLQRHMAGGYAEVEFPIAGATAPTLLGEPVSGRVDSISADFSVIEDYKTHAESAQRGKKRRDEPSNDDAQLNIIRILVARGILQQEPTTYRPRMVAWHTAQVSRRGPAPWISIEAPYMTEEEIGDFRPGGGEYTVLQILEAYRTFRSDRALGVAVDAAAKRIPLMGREMFNKSKCTEYCVAAKYCDRLEGISDEKWGF